jgi:hypothetical protein
VDARTGAVGRDKAGHASALDTRRPEGGAVRNATDSRAACGFGRRDPWSKWHKLVGIDSTRCGTSLFFRTGGGTTNVNPPGLPGQLCQRCFPEARDA